jgi:hypothetical protein
MKRSVAFAVFVVALTAWADDFDTWYEASPNKKLFAVERRIPDRNELSRLDLDGFVVFICAGVSDLPSDVVTQGPVIAQHSAALPLVSSVRFAGVLIPAFSCSPPLVPAVTRHGTSSRLYSALQIAHSGTWRAQSAGALERQSFILSHRTLRCSDCMIPQAELRRKLSCRSPKRWRRCNVWSDCHEMHLTKRWSLYLL